MTETITKNVKNSIWDTYKENAKLVKYFYKQRNDAIKFNFMARFYISTKVEATFSHFTNSRDL